jgi:spermidine synthase
VEIDQAVIDMAKKYLPAHSDGAYDDPRANIVIADGIDFITGTSEKFDLIISDSTDPIGPGEVLFTNSFYGNCRRCLNPGGILVTQNGVPFMQMDEVKGTAKQLSQLFADWHFYTAAVPTYVGGVMSFAWASDDTQLRHIPLERVRENFRASGITTRYYTPDIHRASFALPRYLLDAIGKSVE